MMPAGRYYVGDLCYVMHPQWDEFCDLTIAGQRCLDGEFALKNGVVFASMHTAYGDGVYRDQLGRRYSVDAGLLDCIRAEDIDDSTATISGGQIIDFDRPFHVTYDNGLIKMGHVEIDTAGDDDWDDEEEYED